MSQSKVLVHKLVKVYPTLGYTDLVVTFSYSGPCLIVNFINQTGGVTALPAPQVTPALT